MFVHNLKNQFKKITEIILNFQMQQKRFKNFYTFFSVSKSNYLSGAKLKLEAFAIVWYVICKQVKEPLHSWACVPAVVESNFIPLGLNW